MELKHRKSRIVKKVNVQNEHVIGIPIMSLSEYAFSFKSLPDPADHCQIMPSPSKHYAKIRQSRKGSVVTQMIKLGERVDSFAQGIKEHVRLGPKLSETVKGKLRLGARILQVGGVEKVFKKKFNTTDSEKLKSASQCYLSTTVGPIAGLLFISNERVAFCSDRSIRVSSPSGKTIKLHYKVMIPIRKIKKAVESENVQKPTQKYVQLVTEDNFEFWFMGFLNHQRTLKYLQQEIHQARY